MAPHQPPAAEFVRAFVATSPFARRTGLEVVDLSADRAGGLCFCSVEATDADARTVAAAIGAYRYP